MQHWSVQDNYLELTSMPFYWRLSDCIQADPLIDSRLPVRVHRNVKNDYLFLKPLPEEWRSIENSYRRDANIGFINPESGQMLTYGSSVNSFFLSVISEFKPKSIYEIGCGAGFTIRFLYNNGWDVTGIDPSKYSARWAETLGFKLLNRDFEAGTLPDSADMIYCNDVFEHVPEIEAFSKAVFDALNPGGVFCIATTNSHRSIQLGDISMLEHQHVNMFTSSSIYRILYEAGFGVVRVMQGSYGNTFHVSAIKREGLPMEAPAPVSEGYFARAAQRIESFERFYQASNGCCKFYVPLRCIPYLASVGNYGTSEVFDSNQSWRGKYVDGFHQPIQSLADIEYRTGERVFVGSLTFFEEIKRALKIKGYPSDAVVSIESLGL